jgi:hypothetical protein
LLSPGVTLRRNRIPHGGPYAADRHRVRNAKPGDKPVKLYDERGLFVIVTPAGGKWWRFRYSFDGKEKLLSLGVYPDVSLKDARRSATQARKLIAQGIDPGADRKADKAARERR